MCKTMQTVIPVIYFFWGKKNEKQQTTTTEHQVSDLGQVETNGAGLNDLIYRYQHSPLSENNITSQL